MPSPREPVDRSRYGPARGFELSNSTTAKFLGGAPKAWMTGQNSLRNDSTQGMSRIARPFQPQSHVPTQSTHSSTTTQAPTDSAHHTIPPNPTTWFPQARSPRPEQQVSTVHNKSSELDNVLPSPAPSDEQRQGSICIIDLEHEQPSLNGVTKVIEADVLRGKHGGTEETEKRLGSLSNHTNVVANPSPISQSDANQTVGDLNPNERAPTHPSGGLRRTPSSRVTESSNAIVERSDEHFLPSATVQHFLYVLQYRRLAYDPQSRQGKIVGSRLSLLHDALRASDSVHLVLHQIYCLYSQSQQKLWEICTDFKVIHSLGLKLLSQLLIDNSVLDAEAVDWFSTFPLPLNILLLNQTAFRTAYTKVLNFLEKFHQHWARVKEESRIRFCPPSANELSVMLGLDSTVLQGVLFRAIHRDTWVGQYDQCYKEREQAFFRTQREAQNSRTSNPGLKISENQTYINLSQQFWMRHTTYCLDDATRRARQEAVPMAPPQHRQNSVPTSRTSSASHARRILPCNGPPLTVNARTAQENHHRSAAVPSSLSPNPAISQSSSPIALQEPGSQSFAFQPPDTPSNFPHTAANVRFPISGPPFQNPSTLAITQEASQGSAWPGHLQNPLPPVHQDSNMPVQSFRGPPFVFPGTRSEGQVALRHSNGRTVASLNSALPSSINEARVSSLAPTPLLQSSPNPSNPTTVSGGYATPYPLPPSAPPGPPQVSNVFLRPVEQLPPVATALSAVHQAHIRSPLVIMATPHSSLDANSKYFSYIKDVTILPDRLHMHKRHLKWTWNESQEEFGSLVNCTQAQDGSPSQMLVHLGARLCRIRCIKLNGTNSATTENDWVTAENAWPGGMAIILNGKGLDVKRKLHYGKDMPVNITSSMKQSGNALSIAISQVQPDDNAVYAFGLENIHFTDTSTIKGEMKTISWLEARQRIRTTSGIGDPDVQILDPTITLDLTDPFSSSICQTPVRSIGCRHNQCFDLDTFLSTRGSKAPSQPSGPDQFKCPICGADARPKNLFIDGFFVKVREELEQLKRLDARYIVLDEAGQWAIKEMEATGESGDGTGERKSTTVALQAGLIPLGSEVIELDGGD